MKNKFLNIVLVVLCLISTILLGLFLYNHNIIQAKNVEIESLEADLRLLTIEKDELQLEYDNLKPFDIANVIEENELIEYISKLELQVGKMSLEERIANTHIFTDGSYKTSNITFNYYLYDPNLDNEEHMPLIVSLHGGKGTGNNLERLVSVDKGLCRFISEGLVYPNAVVLMPQSKNGWTSNYSDLMELIEYIVDEYDIDKDRIYLTGISAGGVGAFQMLIKYPNYFAAAVPVAAAVPSYSCKVIKIPVRIYHGSLDTGMGFSVIDADKVMNDNGGQSELVMLKGKGHEIQFVYYDEEYDIFDWLLEHRLSDTIVE